MSVCKRPLSSSESHKHKISTAFSRPYVAKSLTSSWRPTKIYVLCSVMVAKTEYTLYTFINKPVQQHGYRDVTQITINIQEQTFLQTSPYIFPHVQSHSPFRHRRPSFAYNPYAIIRLWSCQLSIYFQLKKTHQDISRVGTTQSVDYWATTDNLTSGILKGWFRKPV